MSTSISRFIDESSKIAYISLFDLYLHKINPPFFEKCGSVDKQIVRRCIIKNTIPEKDHIFVGKHKLSNSKNTRASPYVTETYADKWIYDVNKIIKHREELKIAKKEKLKINITETRIERKHFDETNLKPLPDIVEIEEHERFKDADGNVFRIEIRGEKTQEGLFFKALDFDKLHLSSKPTYDTFTRIGSDYVYDKHYAFFEEAHHNKHTPHWCTNVTKNDDVTQKNDDVTKKKVLYLTYFGVVKSLICSRSHKAKPFQKWAMTTLFTHQFGEEEEKDTLAASLIGVDHRTISSIFRCSSNVIPCIYLFTIGRVSDIRKYCVKNNDPITLDGYADDDVVYKFGRTEDLEDRTKRHGKTYGKMTNDFALETFSYVDKALVSKAETSLNHYFEGMCMKVNDNKRVELVVIPKSKMKHVTEQFKNIQVMFEGNSKEYIHQIDLMRSHFESELLKKDVEIQKKEVEIKIDLMRSHFESELLKKGS